MICPERRPPIAQPIVNGMRCAAACVFVVDCVRMKKDEIWATRPTNAMKRNTCPRQNGATPVFQIWERGINGLGLHIVSMRKKSVADMVLMAAMVRTSGCVMGSFWPARFRKRRKVIIVVRKVRRPGMSKFCSPAFGDGLLGFSSFALLLPSLASAASSSCGGDEDGISRVTMSRQMRTIGTWPANDILQPTRSARIPPRGAPRLYPAMATTVT